MKLMLAASGVLLLICADPALAQRNVRGGTGGGGAIGNGQVLRQKRETDREIRAENQARQAQLQAQLAARQKEIDTQVAAWEGEAKGIEDKAKAEGRELTPAEQQTVTQRRTQIANLKARREATLARIDEGNAKAREETQEDRERNQQMQEDRRRAAGLNSPGARLDRRAQ